MAAAVEAGVVYDPRPHDFEELLRILDGEVRLVTPTQPPEPDRPDDQGQAGKFYQLTHRSGTAARAG